MSKVMLPKIITDIQGLTLKLHDQFIESQSPITDDCHLLHRFCAKLEYFLQSCFKEKSFLGSNKTFWNWMYDSLKRKHGLKDGLRYVRANKEIRTNLGRGRALIRYSLVHQTLADSMQNCIMDQPSCQRHLKPNCILQDRVFAEAFLFALYELNDVIFDLNSGGYDIDSAWPTFASQHFSNQWRAPMRSASFESLNSFATHASLMTAPHMRGIRSHNLLNTSHGGSSDPPSVDQRVEELVLELDQSDRRINEQRSTIEELQSKVDRLQSENDRLSRSGHEEQDILARVISDLQHQKQQMSDTMGQMSVEYENREEIWREKLEEMSQKYKDEEAQKFQLQEKNVQLETDKRNLEETVSQKMTKITESFNFTNANSTIEAETPLQSPLSSSTPISLVVSSSVPSDVQELKAKLSEMEATCNLYQEKLNALRTEKLELAKKFDVEKSSIRATLTAEFENKLENKMLEHTRKNKEFFNSEINSVIEFLHNFIQSDDPCHEPPNLQINTQEYKNLLSSIILMKTEQQELIHHATESEQKYLKGDKEQKSNLQQLSNDLKLSQEEQELLEKENTKLREQFHCMSDELSAVKEQLSTLQTSIIADDVQSRLVDVEAELHMKDNEQRRLMQELDQLRHFHDDSTNEIKKMEESMRDKERTIVSCTASIEELSQTLQLSNVARIELTTDVKQKEETIKQLKMERDELQEKIDSESKHQRMNHEAELASLRDSLEEKDKAATRHREQFELETKKLNNELAQVKKEIIESQSQNEQLTTLAGELQTDNDAIVSSHKEAEKMLNNVKEEKAELEEINSSLESRLDKSVKNAEEVRTRMQVEHESALMAVRDKLQAERDEVFKLKDLLTKASENESKLKSDVSELQGIIEVMKERLIELIKEKDALWKESDELRYLQSLQEKGETIREQWMADQDATKCHKCHTQFSFIVRKHHCRKCGKIYCSNCCDNWVVNDDNKRERYCAACFELEKSKKDIASLSDRSRSISHNSSTRNDEEASFEQITDDEAANTSISVDERTESRPVVTSSDFRDNKLAESTSIPAGNVYRLPIQVDTAGQTLQWSFTTDRSIDFEMMFYAEQGSQEHVLVSKSRCESHVEPVQGEIKVKQVGIYTLIFDNQFSRFMSKTVDFELKLIDS